MMVQQLLRVFQVDTFTREAFKGNPAAVILTETPLESKQMIKISAEINLSETAFLVPSTSISGNYLLRWFTPVNEVKLCGHATLAAAHILFTEYGCNGNLISFDTTSGNLTVKKLTTGKYLMDFPADFSRKDRLDFNLLQSIKDCMPQAMEIMHGMEDLLAIFQDKEQILNFVPEQHFIRKLPFRGLIISAPSNDGDIDFCSRCFYPVLGVDEDPVTDSAHTLLTTYWALKLRKNRLRALQLSSRMGEIECIWKGSRVGLIGDAITVMLGNMYLYHDT